jgi:hypothetical protein
MPCCEQVTFFGVNLPKKWYLRKYEKKVRIILFQILKVAVILKLVAIVFRRGRRSDLPIRTV